MSHQDSEILLHQEVERLKKLCGDRLGEVEHWKREYALLSNELENPDQCEIVKNKIKEEVATLIEGFREDAFSLQRENEELIGQNDILREKLIRSQTAAGFKHIEQTEALERKYEQIIRTLEMERDDLEEVIEKIKIEMSEMLSKEYHFEQLRELEVRLVNQLKLNGGSEVGGNSARISELERHVLMLTCENEKLQS